MKNKMRGKLDEPDKDIEKIWLEESKKRLKFFREGKLKGVPYVAITRC